MKLLLKLNPESASETEIRHFSIREAVRAVVTDDEGKVALLHVKNHSYFKLPGGGTEGSEDKITALKRECKEEVGSDIKIVGEVGKIVEYRKVFSLKQISYCYLAMLKGEKGKPTFTDEEIDDGFEQVWLSYNEALRFLSNNVASSFEGKAYIVPRDTAFLKEVKNYFNRT